MSIAAVLQGARDTLQATMATLGFIPSGQSAWQYCEIQPGGQPPSSMGKWYIALDESSVSNQAKNLLNEVFGITLTITMAVKVFARDRLGQAYTGNPYVTSLVNLDNFERLVLTLHANQNVRTAANGYLGQGDVFQQPLYYTGRGANREESGEWAGATDDSRAFLVRELPFTGCDRVQDLGVFQGWMPPS